MEEARKRLKDMLSWSDRLGSDEISEIQEIIKLLTVITKKTKYILNDDKIHIVKSHGVEINEKIPNEELFEYRITHRESFIDELFTWISEATTDKLIMIEDLKLLLSLEDDYIFSSISTNDYIYSEHSDFNSTCEELIELNETIK